VGLSLAVVVVRPAHPETASPTLTQLAADLAALQTRVTTLEGQVSTLQATVTAQTSQINALQGTVNTQATQIGSLQSAVQTDQGRLTAIETTLAPVSLSGTEMHITGVNLNIRNGLGVTNAAPNGLGNLIVGYNENTNGLPRTGSHNFVVGAEHGYFSYGGLVAGFNNLITPRSHQSAAAPPTSRTASKHRSAAASSTSRTASTHRSAAAIATSRAFRPHRSAAANSTPRAESAHP
jgi:hypothetical protein